jgi:hypothetical protein
MFSAAIKSGSAGASTDPQFNYVTMLLHGDGTNGAQNNTFLDSSTNNFTITRVGNTTQGTFTPYGSNWSVGFTGAQTSPSLTYPSISAYDLGATSQFTYECWVYFSTVSGEQSIMERFSGTSGPGWLLTKLSGNTYRAHFGAGVFIDTGAIAVAGQWIHLAVSRNGSTGSLFVNGTRQATTGSVVNFSDGTDPLVFGERNSGGQTFPFNGYISNARIVKGTYVYDPSLTTITVPIAPLTAITNTVFLGLQSNRYIDNSSNNATATASTASSVQRFSPFIPTTPYSSSVIGGSGYFDGNDYLETPSGSCPVINNFSVSAWVYRTSAPAGQQTFVVLGHPLSGRIGFFWTGSNFEYNIYGSSTVTIDSSGSMPVNAWTYVVLTRTGSSLTLYYNGVLKATVTLGTAFGSATGRSAQFMEGTYGYAANLRFDTAAYPSPTTVPTTLETTTANTNTLLNFTNAGIFDNAMINNLETVGNAQISTSVKKYGTGSMYFDGTGDALYATSQATTFGTGDFTLEFWIYFNAVNNSTTKFVYDMRNSGSTTASFLAQESNNTWTYWNGAGSVLSTGFTSSTFAATTWTHVAICRSSGTTKFFVNGTQTGSVADTSSYANSTLVFGARYNYANELNAYIDDLRISKVARYTANFTPPTAAFPNN